MRPIAVITEPKNKIVAATGGEAAKKTTRIKVMAIGTIERASGATAAATFKLRPRARSREEMSYFEIDSLIGPD
jgi:hypothetical protein